MQHYAVFWAHLEAIAASGCELWYLPLYSPGLRPIEEACSKLIQRLRPAGARTRKEVYRAIASAIDQISALDAHGFFNDSGYGSKVQ